MKKLNEDDKQEIKEVVVLVLKGHKVKLGLALIGIGIMLGLLGL